MCSANAASGAFLSDADWARQGLNTLTGLLRCWASAALHRAAPRMSQDAASSAGWALSPLVQAPVWKGLPLALRSSNWLMTGLQQLQFREGPDGPCACGRSSLKVAYDTHLKVEALAVASGVDFAAWAPSVMVGT